MTLPGVPVSPYFWMNRYPVIPSARKLIAVPEMIWSDRNWIDQTAWIVANVIPASAAVPRPTIQAALPAQLLAQIAPQMPKNAPLSSIPSSATLITPLRSQKSPPIAANVSGVA